METDESARSLWVVVLFVSVALLAGCHGDPNVRKQKYLESGKRYSAEGKYREAAIQFSNALKVDKNFADAHYDLAQTYVHLGAIERRVQRTVAHRRSCSPRTTRRGSIWETCCSPAARPTTRKRRPMPCWQRSRITPMFTPCSPP